MLEELGSVPLKPTSCFTFSISPVMRATSLEADLVHLSGVSGRVVVDWTIYVDRGRRRPSSTTGHSLVAGKRQIFVLTESRTRVIAG